MSDTDAPDKDDPPAGDAATADTDEQAEAGDPAEGDPAVALDGEDASSAAALSDEQALAGPGGDAGGRSSAFMGVPIEVLICVGKARPLVSDLVKLRRDSVISLDSRIDDPVEVYIGDRLIARGELQEMEEQEGQLGVRLTEVADLSNAV